MQSRIRISPYVLELIVVELELNFTSNPPQHMWIEVYNIQTRP